MKELMVTIKVTDKKGVGVFANRDIFVGELVVRGRMLKRVSKRTNYSFQIDQDVHVQLDKMARSLNHSCNPNTGVRNNHLGGYDFIALRTIRKGEEITWDYATTEYISISVQNCICGSRECRGKIRGFEYLPKSIKNRYGEFIAGYLKQSKGEQFLLVLAKYPTKSYYKENYL